MTDKNLFKAMKVLDGLAHDDAIESVENDAVASEDLAHFALSEPEALRRLQAHFSSEMASLKRQRLDAAREDRKASKLPNLRSLLEMTREQIVESITQIQLQFPDLKVAHRDLEEMTDEDLRSLLADFQRLTGSDGD